MLSGVCVYRMDGCVVANGTDGVLRAGLLTAGFCNLCIATSLAEFLSAYPT